MLTHLSRVSKIVLLFFLVVIIATNLWAVGCALTPAPECSKKDCLWTGSIGEAHFQAQTTKVSKKYVVTNQALYNYMKDVREGRTKYSDEDYHSLFFINNDLYQISGNVTVPLHDSNTQDTKTCPIPPGVTDTPVTKISFTCGDTTVWVRTIWEDRWKTDLQTQVSIPVSSRILVIDTFQLDEGGEHDQSKCEIDYYKRKIKTDGTNKSLFKWL